MAVMQWTSQFALGIKEIDDQHAQLVKMINDLDDAMKEGRARDMMARLLNSLVSYCKMHFTTEELYFSEFEFDGTASHRSEHMAFIDKVGQFKRAFDGGTSDISSEVMGFLADWLKHHINGSDRGYVKCFKEHGLK